MFLLLSLIFMWSYWFEEDVIHFAGLLEQEEQEEDWRDACINFHLAKVWTIPIFDIYFIYLQNHMHLFQPQYIDGLLYPSLRNLFFTIELVTPLGRALSILGFYVFLPNFCKVSGPSYKLGTPFEFVGTTFLPS